MRPTILALLAALALSGCLSEINKPIGPNDRWAETTDILSRPPAAD